LRSKSGGRLKSGSRRKETAVERRLRGIEDGQKRLYAALGYVYSMEETARRLTRVVGEIERYFATVVPLAQWLSRMPVVPGRPT
jgi:hypothetical protein